MLQEIPSKLDLTTAEYAANYQELEKKVAELENIIATISLGGGAAAAGKHTARNKLLPRERIKKLLDLGSFFLELSQLAAFGMYYYNWNW
jgi:3-methylcrotonyl-CoA carboxylase beta subunit